MDAHRHARIKQLFFEICDLPTGDRLAALDRACGDDRELHREIRSLLSFHDDPEVMSLDEHVVVDGLN